MKTKIFYFSGTGNSLRVSQLLSKVLGNTEIISIPNFKDTLELTDVNIVGIVFPVYAWTMPKIVKTFLNKLVATKKNNCYYFAVCTMKNQSGIAIEQIKSIFTAAGKKLSAGYEVKMPGNAILAYDIENTDTIQGIIDKADKQITEIGNEILSLPENSITKTPFIKYVYLNVLGSIGLSMTPDKKYTTNKNCNGCGICKKVCPTNNIELKNGMPIWLKKKCEYCMACIHWCPQKSIQCGTITTNRKRYHHPSIKLNDMILNNK